jgi:all-trans-retinol dehydrogenase (NAD+)
MFKGVKTRFPLMLPILKESDVADRVVSAILRDKQRVIMPFSVKLMPLMRMLPVPVFDAIANLLGVNVSMEEFVGRHAAEPPRAVEANDAE